MPTGCSRPRMICAGCSTSNTKSALEWLVSVRACCTSASLTTMAHPNSRVSASSRLAAFTVVPMTATHPRSRGTSAAPCMHAPCSTTCSTRASGWSSHGGGAAPPRRDLHDGIGPARRTHAEAETPRALLPPQAEDAADQPEDLSDDSIDGHRRAPCRRGVGCPPALDELGLGGARRQAVDRLTRPAGVNADVQANGDLSKLPAAVDRGVSDRPRGCNQPSFGMRGRAHVA